jgi:pimeloyl-ACP methyl ester carboxylesterase
MTEESWPITTYFRVYNGVRVRFADTKADSDATLLLLAPWPESLWAFRRIWDRVSSVGRVVAIDLPGFGHSDGRPELIAPDAAGAFLAGLIGEWGLGAPHIVGPDVGTAAALFLAAQTPARVTSLTIGGGAVRFPIEAGGALKDIIEAPSLDAVRELDARTNIGYAVEQAAASDSEPDVHEDYVSAYDLGRFAESARFVRHYPEQNPVLRDLLPTITTPTQILAGRNDDLVPWSNNQYLDDLLPNSEIHPLDAGHFAWEQGLGQRGISAPRRRLGAHRPHVAEGAVSDRGAARPELLCRWHRSIARQVAILEQRPQFVSAVERCNRRAVGLEGDAVRE